MTEEQLAHIGDDELPPGVYNAADAAVVRYARLSSEMDVITDEFFAELSQHFSTRQLIDLCLTVGMCNMINRFHRTFLTDVDPETQAVLAPQCPLPLPEPPPG